MSSYYRLWIELANIQSHHWCQQGHRAGRIPDIRNIWQQKYRSKWKKYSQWPSYAEISAGLSPRYCFNFILKAQDAAIITVITVEVLVPHFHSKLWIWNPIGQILFFGRAPRGFARGSFSLCIQHFDSSLNNKFSCSPFIVLTNRIQCEPAVRCFYFEKCQIWFNTGRRQGGLLCAHRNKHWTCNKQWHKIWQVVAVCARVAAARGFVSQRVCSDGQGWHFQQVARITST